MVHKGEKVVVKLHFHLTHGLFNDGSFQLALPDDNHLPSVLEENLIILLVPLLIPSYLIHPKFAVALRNLATFRIFNCAL